MCFHPEFLFLIFGIKEQTERQLSLMHIVNYYTSCFVIIVLNFIVYHERTDAVTYCTCFRCVCQ